MTAPSTSIVQKAVQYNVHEHGTYQDELGQEQCKTCPAGSFCLETYISADDSADFINIIEPQLCALMIIVQAVVLCLYCVYVVLIQLT